MSDKDLSEKVFTEFVALQSDAERVEYLMASSPKIRDFELKAKLGTKSLEQSIKLREEGNRFFQAEQTMQSILFYNKSIAMAPHPTVEEYFAPPPPPDKVNSVHVENKDIPMLVGKEKGVVRAPTPEPPPPGQKVTPAPKRKNSMSDKKKKSPPSKYEPLALSYANRSAALRRLCQYEECLLDIARAAKFGYPKENVFKLWERKGKCYQGLKKYELATKCLRQAIQSLKEAHMTDNQRALKTHELTSLLKEWRNTHLVMQMTDGVTKDLSNTSTAKQAGKEPAAQAPAEEEKPMMGATGPLVLIKEAPPSKWSKDKPPTPTPPSPPGEQHPSPGPPPPSPPYMPPSSPVPRGQGGGKPPMMARKNQSVIEGPKLELLNTCQSTMSRTGDSLPPFRPSVTSLPAGQSLYLMQDNNYNAQQQPSSPPSSPIQPPNMMASLPLNGSGPVYSSSGVLGGGPNGSVPTLNSPTGSQNFGVPGSPQPPHGPASPNQALGVTPSRQSYSPARQNAGSQMSISQIPGSGPGVTPVNKSAASIDSMDIPELSFGCNPRMPSASSAIDLKFEPDKGRFFVAARDLEPGDVILREEPYAAVLEAIFRVNHCGHCLKKTPTPIPCFECSTVQYCSETCRDLSWNYYHSIECGILAYLEPSRYLGKLPHLALRTITKTGMQSLIKHSLKNGAAVEESSGVGSTALAVGGGEVFDPTAYRSVHNLATNSAHRPFEDLIKKTAEAIFMSKCLKFNGFFGADKTRLPTNGGDAGGENQQHSAEVFISTLLLRHLQIVATNGLEMAECILKNNDITKFDILPVGGAIFPTMSFFNHSCYPNALRVGYQNYQVVRVIRSVPRGCEVNIDYGFDFYANPREKRMKRADGQYHFDCACVACAEDWPTYDLLGPPRVRQFQAEVTPEVAEMVDYQSRRYKMAMDHLIRLDVAKAMPIFREYLMAMEGVVGHPDQRYIDCEEAYKQCLWLENRGYKVLPPASSPALQPQQQHFPHTPKSATSASHQRTSVVSFDKNTR